MPKYLSRAPPLWAGVPHARGQVKDGRGNLGTVPVFAQRKWGGPEDGARVARSQDVDDDDGTLRQGEAGHAPPSGRLALIRDGCPEPGASGRISCEGKNGQDLSTVGQEAVGRIDVSPYYVRLARVAELADALDLGSSGATRPGSNPGSRIGRRDNDLPRLA